MKIYAMYTGGEVTGFTTNHLAAAKAEYSLLIGSLSSAGDFYYVVDFTYEKVESAIACETFGLAMHSYQPDIEERSKLFKNEYDDIDVVAIKKIDGATRRALLVIHR